MTVLARFLTFIILCASLGASAQISIEICDPRDPRCDDRRCDPRDPRCDDRRCDPRDPRCDDRRCDPRDPRCRDPRGPQGQLICTSRDNGWEEHMGGHATCRECTRAHGNCTETCESTVHECSAVGVNRQGQQEQVLGRGDTQYRAEDEALWRCDRYLSGCRIHRCNRASEVVSRRSCR